MQTEVVYNGAHHQYPLFPLRPIFCKSLHRQLILLWTTEFYGHLLTPEPSKPSLSSWRSPNSIVWWPARCKCALKTCVLRDTWFSKSGEICKQGFTEIKAMFYRHKKIVQKKCDVNVIPTFARCFCTHCTSSVVQSLNISEWKSFTISSKHFWWSFL